MTHFGQVHSRRINRHVQEEEDPTKSEIVIRVAVRGGPRRCNGARLIRPPAANNILIWRPLAVRSLLLPSLSRLLRFFFIVPLVRSLTLASCELPPKEIVYLPPPTHTYATSLRDSSLLVTTRFVTHIYVCFMGRSAYHWRVPLILGSLAKRKLIFLPLY